MGSWAVDSWGRLGSRVKVGVEDGRRCKHNREALRALMIQHEWLKFSDCSFDEISPLIPNQKIFLSQKITDLQLNRERKKALLVQGFGSDVFKK